jgi:hypothetical protein
MLAWASIILAYKGGYLAHASCIATIVHFILAMFRILRPPAENHSQELVSVVCFAVVFHVDVVSDHLASSELF